MICLSSIKTIRAFAVSCVCLVVYGWNARKWSSQTTEHSIPVSLLAEIAHKRLSTLQENLDTARYEGELGLSLQSSSIESYESDLQDIYTRFLQPAEPQTSVQGDVLLENVLSHLSLTTASSQRELPRRIVTTSKRPTFPEQFQTWATQNPDWKVVYAGDKAIDDLMERAFAKPEGSVEPSIAGKDRDETSSIVEKLEALKFGVLKADVYRYLTMLLEGGVYTDTDTACVRSLKDWPGLYTSSPGFRTLNDPFLATTPLIFRIAAGETVDEVLQEYEEPSLVIAFEHDQWAQDKDWRELGHARGMQFVQWTLMAKPYHPIFLDVLGQILRKVEETDDLDLSVAQDSDKMSEEESEALRSQRISRVLDMTGPGAFSDAVFRYLLVRYGVHPSEISGHSRAVRVGDVLIYPMHSFRADASEGEQGDYKLVWHGFFGSWKDEE